MTLSEKILDSFGNPAIVEKVPGAILETLAMVGASTVFTALIGLSLGLLLYTISNVGIRPAPRLYSVISFFVNIVRSVPFIILIIALLPLTRLIANTTLGWRAAIIPLSIGAIPFFARLVETAAREVDPGKIEAALMFGASRMRVAGGVIVREALPSLIAGLTTTVIALVSYSAIGGAFGAGGLGFIAVSYGYQRFETGVMIIAVGVIVVLVQIVQSLGDFFARMTDHR